MQTERLDVVCTDHRVDKVHMIKIDAEGSELAVVQGAQGIIERDRPEIYVEVGPEELTGDGGPVSAFLRGLYTLKSSLCKGFIYLFTYPKN